MKDNRRLQTQISPHFISVLAGLMLCSCSVKTPPAPQKSHPVYTPITTYSQYIECFATDLRAAELTGDRTRGLRFLEVDTTKDTVVPVQPLLLDNPDLFGGQGKRQITIDGRASRWWTNGGSTSCYPTKVLSEVDLNRLTHLVSILPPDDGQLPPKGHRVLVEAIDRGKTVVRLYDRNHLPTEVREIFGIIDAGD